MIASIDSSSAASTAVAILPGRFEPGRPQPLINRNPAAQGAIFEAPEPPKAPRADADPKLLVGLEQPKAAMAMFRHPAYSGMCHVTLARGETRQSVLAYLNNPMSSGKTYCNNTSIRGGWVDVTGVR